MDRDTKPSRAKPYGLQHHTCVGVEAHFRYPGFFGRNCLAGIDDPQTFRSTHRLSRANLQPAISHSQAQRIVMVEQRLQALHERSFPQIRRDLQ